MRWASRGRPWSGCGHPACSPTSRSHPSSDCWSCADSASGASARLDPREWGFLNTELTVHLLRPPVGEWICLDAETTLSTGAVGIATAEIHDELGLVGRSSQALLIRPRSG